MQRYCSLQLECPQLPPFRRSGSGAARARLSLSPSVLPRSSESDSAPSVLPFAARPLESSRRRFLSFMPDVEVLPWNEHSFLSRHGFPLPSCSLSWASPRWVSAARKRLVVPQARIALSTRHPMTIGLVSRVSSRNWPLGARKLERQGNDGRRPRPSCLKSRRSPIRDSNSGISACRWPIRSRARCMDSARRFRSPASSASKGRWRSMMRSGWNRNSTRPVSGSLHRWRKRISTSIMCTRASKSSERTKTSWCSSRKLRRRGTVLAKRPSRMSSAPRSRFHACSIDWRCSISRRKVSTPRSIVSWIDRRPDRWGHRKKFERRFWRSPFRNSTSVPMNSPPRCSPRQKASTVQNDPFRLPSVSITLISMSRPWGSATIGSTTTGTRWWWGSKSRCSMRPNRRRACGRRAPAWRERVRNLPRPARICCSK